MIAVSITNVYAHSDFCQNATVLTSKRRSSKSTELSASLCLLIYAYSRYIVERLPEGGEGMYGIDDGEGDD